MAYTGFLMTAATWALASSLAPEIGGLDCVVLLVAALHNCWTMTLIISSAGPVDQMKKAAWRGFLNVSA